MKISSRIPSIGGQESSEGEIRGQEKPTQTRSTNFRSRSDKFEGPDSVSRHTNESLFEKYKSSRVGVPPSSDVDIPSFNPNAFRIGLLGGGTPNQNKKPEDSQHSRTRSTSDHYKGPNSLQLPEIVSKVDSYKGPDSIQPPRIESPVSNYKGPKSLVQESGVNQYIGLDKTPRRISEPPSSSAEDVLDNFPRNPSGRGLFGDIVGSNESSTDPQSSPIDSRVDNYIGPDSIQPPQIESKVEKDKLPDFVEIAKTAKK